MTGVYTVSAATAPISDYISKFVGDDWVIPFTFTDNSGAPVDLSSATFAASLITSTASTPVATIDASQAAQGTITVTVGNSLTSVLTPDVDSPHQPTDGRRIFTTRVALYTSSPTINTSAVVPVQVIQR